MGFEDFEPIFGEVKVDLATSNQSSDLLNPYMFHVYASDTSNLEVHVTDFKCYTWGASRSTEQLEDMRDVVGIGGSWSEFVDYFASALKTNGAKLVLEGHAKSNGDELKNVYDRAAFICNCLGPTCAKLVVQRTKGMPLIKISLNKLVDSAAGEAMAKLSLELFRVLRNVKTSLAKEQDRSCQLIRMISEEREKSQSMKSQLDELLYPKRQKLQQMSSVKGSMAIGTFDPALGIASQKSSGSEPVFEKTKPGKVGTVVLPAHRRAKVRGAVLHDADEED